MELRSQVKKNLDKYLSVKKSENVEKSIYNFAINYCNTKDIEKDWKNRLFVHTYKLKFCEIFSILKTDKVLIEKIEKKEILAKDVAFSELVDKDVVHDEIVEDGLFECRKCGSKKTTYYSLQTRSSDEPMTNFITCVNCKNRWKM